MRGRFRLISAGRRVYSLQTSPIQRPSYLLLLSLKQQVASQASYCQTNYSSYTITLPLNLRCNKSAHGIWSWRKTMYSSEENKDRHEKLCFFPMVWKEIWFTSQRQSSFNCQASKSRHEAKHNIMSRQLKTQVYMFEWVSGLQYGEEIQQVVVQSIRWKCQ